MYQLSAFDWMQLCKWIVIKNVFFRLFFLCQIFIFWHTELIGQRNHRASELLSFAKNEKFGTNDRWNYAIKYLEAIAYLDADSALRMTYKLQAIAEKSGIRNFEAMVNLQRALAHHMKSDFLKAVEQCQIAYYKCTDKPCRDAVLLQYAYYLILHKNYHEAYRILNYLYNEFTTQNMHHEAAEALKNIGIIYYFREDYITAATYYQKALVEASFDKETVLMSDILYSLADTYYQVNDFDECKKLYLKSLELSDLSQDHYGSCLTLQRLTSLCLEEHNYSQGMVYAKTAYALALQLKNRDEISNCLAYLVQLSTYLDSPSEIEKYSQAYLEFDFEFHVPVNKSNVLNYLSDYYAKKSNIKAAKELAYQSLNIAQKHDDLDAMIVAARVLKERLAQSKDYVQYFLVSEQLDSMIEIKETEALTAKAELTKKGLELKEKAGFVNNSLLQFRQLADREKEVQLLVRNILIVVLVNLFFILFLGYRIYLQKIKTSKVILAEKEKSESLLLNILPKSIAEELKANGKVKAKMIENVTVMFIDIVGFTHLTEKLSPDELVEEIDRIYKEFDTITEKYEIEKIKTIGDAYMCAGGLTEGMAGSTNETILAAIEIRDYIQKRKSDQAKSGKKSFEIRIGIHTGTVVAGVVGSRKFAYDIWGDTVNIASRMESSSEQGKINISEATKSKLREAEFVFEPRGQIIAKNKGPMEMYFVEKNLDNVT